jgi:hypothetical protein
VRRVGRQESIASLQPGTGRSVSSRAGSGVLG